MNNPIMMVDPKYSNSWRRFGAAFLDGLLFHPLGWLYAFIMHQTSSTSVRLAAFIFYNCATLVYFIAMHARFGQTIGKMICKIIVLDVSERPLTLRQAVLRDIFPLLVISLSIAVAIPKILLGIDPMLPASFTWVDWGIGYSGLVWVALELITMLTNSKRRALHDFIAHSVVIRKA